MNENTDDKELVLAEAIIKDYANTLKLDSEYLWDNSGCDDINMMAIRLMYRNMLKLQKDIDMLKAYLLNGNVKVPNAIESYGELKTRLTR